MKAIKHLISGVLTLVLIMQPAFAFSLFKKKVSELPDYINEEIYINRLFQASDGVYKLHITILIPKGLETMTVTVSYDQLKQKKIKDLAWVKASSQTTKFLNIFRRNHKKKTEFERIFPFRKEEFVKESYEFDGKNPDLHYDRVSEQRFEVYKKYQFYQKEVFGNGRRKTGHLLEFHFEDGTVRAIDIRKEVYHGERYTTEDKFLPTLFGKGIKPDPRYSPKQILPKDLRDDANKEYNQYLKRQNNTIKTRNEEVYERTMQELENSYGTGRVPDYDGLYRDKK